MVRIKCDFPEKNIKREVKKMYRWYTAVKRCGSGRLTRKTTIISLSRILRQFSFYRSSFSLLLSFFSPPATSLFCSCVPAAFSAYTKPVQARGEWRETGQPTAINHRPQRARAPARNLTPPPSYFPPPPRPRHKLNSRATHVAVYPYTRCRPPTPALFFTRRWTEFLLLTAH